MDIYSSITDNKNKMETDFKDCSDFLLRAGRNGGFPSAFAYDYESDAQV